MCDCCRSLLHGCDAGFLLLLCCGLYLGGLFLDQFDEVVGVFEAVVGEAADIDLMGRR